MDDGSCGLMALFIVCILITLFFGILCYPFARYGCYSKASNMGLNNKYVFYTDTCYVEYQKNKWIDINHYRVIGGGK